MKGGAEQTNGTIGGFYHTERRKRPYRLTPAGPLLRSTFSACTGRRSLLLQFDWVA